MERLIGRLAAASETTPAKAADELDKLVHRIHARLRRGQSANVPGLGRFTPALGLQMRFDPEGTNDQRRQTPRSSR
jgi:hypothetical protein